MNGNLTYAHIAKNLDIMFLFVVGCSLSKATRLIKKELTKEGKRQETIEALQQIS